MRCSCHLFALKLWRRHRQCQRVGRLGSIVNDFRCNVSCLVASAATNWIHRKYQNGSGYFHWDILFSFVYKRIRTEWEKFRSLFLVGRCSFDAPFGLAIKCLEWVNFSQLLSSLSAYCFLPCSSFASCFIFFRFGLFTRIRTFSSCCEVAVSASTRWNSELCMYFRSKLC